MGLGNAHPARVGMSVAEAGEPPGCPEVRLGRSRKLLANVRVRDTREMMLQEQDPQKGQIGKLFLFF